MISSKKISIISIALITVALIFALATVLMPQLFMTGSALTGEFKYSDNHTVSVYEEDYYTDYISSVVKINLSDNGSTSSSKNVLIDGNEISIMAGGNYLISGSLSDGHIRVSSNDNNIVRLVLNNAELTCLTGSPLIIEQSEKTIISTISGTVNTISDGEEYKIYDNMPEATVFSKDDLVINGRGKLVINGNYKDGLKVNDGLKITEGSVEITAKEDGINANDYFFLAEADIKISSQKDGIKLSVSDDEDKGFVAFQSGSVNITAAEDGVNSSNNIYINGTDAVISAEDDGIHSDKTVFINGGKVDIIKSVEGIEGQVIEINDGMVKIIASDDGVNARGTGMGGMHMQRGGSSSEVLFSVNGGNIYIEARGDGIDSNAAALINGGYIEVHGPENNGNSSLDFDGSFRINGGTVLAVGSSGMAESPSEDSTANTITAYLSSNYNQGSQVILQSADGTQVVSFTANKKFSWICISTPDIKSGETYKLYVNNEEIGEVKIEASVSTLGSDRGMRRF